MRILYLLLIAAANLLTAKFDPLVLGGGALIVPLGSLFAGAVFVLRDLVQIKHGRLKTYTLILCASVLSSVLSILLGDTAHVAVASVVAFFISESVDTEIFSRLRKTLAKRVLISGIVGGCLDSVVFVILGLSPLGSNTLTWGAVPSGVLGQLLVKSCVQFTAAIYLLIRNKTTRGRTRDNST